LLNMFLFEYKRNKVENYKRIARIVVRSKSSRK